MSDPALDAAKKVLSDQFNKVKTMEEKNKEIKSELIDKINEVISSINKLEDQTNITEDAKKQFSGLIQDSKPKLRSINSQTTRLLQLVESIDVSSINLNFLKISFFPLEVIKNEYNSENIINLPSDLLVSLSIVNGVYDYIEKYKILSGNLDIIINSNITNMLNEAEAELKELKLTKNILKNIKTQDYYEKESTVFLKKSNNYRNIFIGLIFISLSIAVVSVVAEPRFYMDTFDYWFLKISYILVSITLITYFLKQSTHYQRLGDQANQTSLEIKAFPSFISGSSKVTEAEIRKELALKYFGREIDSAAHKDMSNLISDQMKSTTEMVKAATDVLKVKG